MRSVKSATGSVTNSEGHTETGQDCWCVWPGSVQGILSPETFLLQGIGPWTWGWSPVAPVRKASGQSAFLMSRWIPPSRLPWQPQLGLGGSAPGPSQSRSGRDTCGGVTCCCWGAPRKLLPGQCRTLGSGGRRGGRGEAEPGRGWPGAGRRPSGGDGGGRAGGGAAGAAAASRAEG